MIADGISKTGHQKLAYWYQTQIRGESWKETEIAAEKVWKYNVRNFNFGHM